LGLNWVEIDIRYHPSGEFILLHDETVDKTTIGTGFFSEFSLEALTDLDAGQWFSFRFEKERIPRLQDVLALARQHELNINLEIKQEQGDFKTTCNALISTLKKHWPKEATPPLISSFNYTLLDYYRSLENSAPLGYLADTFELSHLQNAKAIHATTFHLSFEHISPTCIRLASQAGIPVWAYVVNDLTTAKHLLSMGVQGLFTDKHDLIISHKPH